MASITCSAPAQIDAGDSTTVDVLPGDTKYVVMREHVIETQLPPLHARYFGQLDSSYLHHSMPTQLCVDVCVCTLRSAFW